MPDNPLIPNVIDRVTVVVLIVDLLLVLASRL